MAIIISLKENKDILNKSGAQPGDYIRLKDVTTQFYDKHIGFHISGNEIKRIPDKMSQKTVAAIRAGRFNIIKKADLAKIKKGEANKE